MYSIKSVNKYIFAIGTNKSIHLAFNKYGRLINDKSKARLCQNKSLVFNLHTKTSDNLQENNDDNDQHHHHHHHQTDVNNVIKNENLFLNLKLKQKKNKRLFKNVSFIV
jgi:hypothetical protein